MKRRAAIIVAIALILTTIGVTGVFSAISTSAFSANEQSSQREENVDNASGDTQDANKALERLIAEGSGDTLVTADLQLNVGMTPTQLAGFVHQHQLKVTQLKLRISGLSEDLSGGYVIQPRQTIEQALDQFEMLQQPFFTRKIAGVEDDLANEPDPTKKAARERQLIDLRAYQQQFQTKGLLVSSLIVQETVRELQHLLENSPEIQTMIIRSAGK